MSREYAKTPERRQQYQRIYKPQRIFKHTGLTHIKHDKKQEVYTGAQLLQVAPVKENETRLMRIYDRIN